MKIVGIIPAHMASVRFSRKILYQFHGLPMIEHVRRRAMLCDAISEVIVATCDEEIASVVKGFGGRVVMTGNDHKNGTNRVAEAVKHIDCSHVILIQGDEPLLLPRHLSEVTKAIMSEPLVDSWNATGSIENVDELDRHSFVKCAINSSNKILYCFRRSPSFSSFTVQKEFVRKVLGIIGYRKRFLLELTSLMESTIEQSESIEQMRIIENSYTMKSVAVYPSLPSVNEPSEVKEVLSCMTNDPEQSELLKKIL